MTRASSLLAGLGVAAALGALPACTDGTPRAPTAPVIVHDLGHRSSPADWDVILDLSGTWDFRIGDRARWRQSGPPAEGWDTMMVPSAWEDEGYFGYDGFGWYRRTFTLDGDDAKRAVSERAHLLLGQIDDADEVWIDGVYLGRGGRMPPSYATGFYEERAYPVPPDLLHPDSTHTITVRVYDDGREGGILTGLVALAVPAAGTSDAVPFVADLSGDWLFSVDDHPARAGPGSGLPWDTLRVPGTWEGQGFAGVDGYAWYRTSTSLSASDLEADLMLVLGAIDDLDQAFVNGVAVGQTGDLDRQRVRGDEWLQERAYPVPRGLLSAGVNTIAVRVYDSEIDGGIHLGPVGLMTAATYDERLSRHVDGGR